MEENYQEKQREILEGLTPDEERIWNEINDIIDSYTLNKNKNRIPVQEMDETQRIFSQERIDEMEGKKIAFGKKLENEGIDPYKYILWHKFIGSSERKNLKFDTEDHRIAEFMRAFYSEYKQ